jgi:hypothetical protein
MDVESLNTAMGQLTMPIDIDESKVQWDESPKINEQHVTWDEDASQPKTNQGWRGDIAAGLRGVREAIPFARDIGAGAEALRKGVSFAEEKQRQAARDAVLAEEHPWSYGAGEVVGGLGSLAVPEAAGLGLIGKGAKGESFLVNKLAPMLGSTTEAKLVAGALTGAGAGAAQGAIHGLGTGTTAEERLGSAAEEAIPGAVSGVVGAGLGHLGARGLRKAGELTGLTKALPPAPTSADLLKKGREAYEKSKAQYLHVKPEPIKNLYNDVLSAMEERGYDPEVHTSMKPALRKLRDATSPQSLEQLDRIHRMTTAAAKNWQKPEDQMMAGIFRGKLDDFLENLDPKETISATGNPQIAKDALNEGRQFWKQGKKTQLLDEALETAKNRAASTGSGGNFNNAYRQEVKKIYDKARKNTKLWTADELQAMKEFVRGGLGRNALRALEILSPMHHRALGALELFHGLTDPAGSLGAAGLGTAAHYGEQKLAEKAAANLGDIVKMGGKKANISTINPVESLTGRAISVPSSTGLVMRPQYPAITADDREERASGGSVNKRDYPAKRLTRMERAVKRAQDAIALETKPILNEPDHVVARALEIAKG